MSKKPEPDLSELKGLVESYLRSAGEEAADGDNLSYAAVPLAVESYGELIGSNPATVDYDDFTFLFSLVRLPSTNGIPFEYEPKLSLLESCHLRNKEALRKLLDQGKSDNTCIGLFTMGEGRLSKKKISDTSARNFIAICVDVKRLLDSGDANAAISSLENELKIKDLKGIGPGMTADILHCLNPQTFPILNNSEGNGLVIYRALGCDLRRQDQSDHKERYAQNAKAVRTYRDTYFPGVNFRVFDNAQRDPAVAACIERRGAGSGQHWLFRTMWPGDERRVAGLGIGETQPYPLGEQADAQDGDYGFLDISEAKMQKIEDIFDTVQKGDLVVAYDDASGDHAAFSGMCEVAAIDSTALEITLRKTAALRSGKTIGDLAATEPLLADLVHFNHMSPGVRGRMCKLSEEQYDAIIKSCGGATTMGDENDLVGVICEEVKAAYNLILHGAPGTGKTYLARQVAARIIECEPEALTDPNIEGYQGCHKQFDFVQFHPSYDYTDFVEGLRPVKSGDGIGFELKDGTFSRFLGEARSNPNKKFVFVIDEINRGDISKIFGELFFSIDPGYRGPEGGVLTQYANMHGNPGERLYVPENVYVIGTMNDIDRSVDTFDFAMRRRFRFRELTPDNTAAAILGGDTELIERLGRLNEAIDKNPDLGPTYEIGASYLLGPRGEDGARHPASRDELERIWEHQLDPLVREYLRGTRGEVEMEKTLEVMHAALCGEIATGDARPDQTRA